MKIRNTAKIIKENHGLTAAIIGSDNVPSTQEYDEATGAYFPDWTTIPLILVPDIRKEDGSLVPDIDISNKAWYILQADGTETQIVSTPPTPGYELWPTGYLLGLKVTKNIPVGAPVGLVFRFKALGFEGMAKTTLIASNNPAPTPDVELDFPTASVWNPFDTDRDKVTITPTVRDYGKTGLVVEWEKRGATAWRTIDPTDPEDCELSLDPATNALTIDRRWMGEKISVRCRLIDNSGPTPIVLRERPVTIRRRIPEYSAEILMCSTFSDSDPSVMAEAYVRVGKTRCLNPSAELRLKWYEGNAVIGEGNKQSYPTRNADTIDASLDIEDRGPLKLLTYDGKYLTYDGKLLGGR